MKGLLIALKYLPLVVEVVIAVEEVYYGKQGHGKTKKQLVLDAINAVGDTFADRDESTLKVIGTLIDSVVGTFNAFGWVK